VDELHSINTVHWRILGFVIAYKMPNSTKTCSNGHTSSVPIAKLTCFCGAQYPLYENRFNQKFEIRLACANPECDNKFEKIGGQKYCSAECRKEHYYAKNRNMAYPNLTTGNIGTIGELGVAADLLKRGYDVFKSVSQSCWTDLVIYAKDRFQSVEVKTGSRTTTGRLVYGKPYITTDIVAILLPNNEIVYIPPFES
jgi:hypothetical protein